MRSMENIVEGMKKKNILNSLGKNHMNIPHVVPQVDAVGMIWMISGSQIMMNSLGRICKHKWPNFQWNEL